MKVLKSIFTKIEIVVVSFILMGTFFLLLRDLDEKPHLFLPTIYFIYVGISVGLFLLLYKKFEKFMKKCWVQLLYALAVGLWIRLMVAYGLSLTQQGDLSIYLSTAHKLYNNFDISNLYYGIFPHALHYPMFVNLMYKIFGYHGFVMDLVNLLFSGAEIAFVYLIIREFFNEKNRLLVTLLVILNPASILLILFTGGESIYSAMILGALYLIFQLYKKESDFVGKKRIFLSIGLGLIMGVADFFRPTAIILIIALLIEELLFQKITIKRRLTRWVPIALSFFAISFMFQTMTTSITGYLVPDKSYGWNLFVGANYESNGKWNAADGDEFKKIIIENEDPNDIQMYFYEKAIQRYKGMILSGKIIDHFAEKLFVWQSEDFLSVSVTSWQHPYTRYPSESAYEVIDLICFLFQIICFVLMLILMIGRRIKKQQGAFLNILGDYLIGCMCLFMLLEVANRYKMAYYSVIVLYVLIAGRELYITIKKNSGSVETARKES
jgi:4-amino-4-deoxy-L-arabinose transferase-like glycosyltransferase